MSRTPAQWLEQTQRALASQDASAHVESDAASGALRVHSELDPATVLKVLQSAALTVSAAAEPAERSDCCGGCCGA